MDSAAPLPLLGILGSGKLGSVLARRALKVGYRVLVANSGDPDRLAMALSYLAPGAEACRASELAEWADILCLALPFEAFLAAPLRTGEGKIVIDMMNYLPEAEGAMPGLEERPEASSEAVQARLPGARVVKTLNHLGFHEVEEDALAPGSPGRRALGLAGDDSGARAEVALFLSRLGFDSLDLGPLRAGRILGPGGPIFGKRLSLEDLAGLAGMGGL